MISVTKKLAPICVTAAAICALALGGCGSTGSTDGLTGGVAATVNGTEISEDKVTTYIMDIRANQSLEADSDWANWLNTSGYTPSSLREAVIEMFISQELEKEAAQENGVEVTDEEVDAVVESMRSNYDSDEAWVSALASAGLTEDAYRENVYQPMLEEKLIDVVVSDEDATADDETVLTYASLYGSSLDGMKRSSHILFASDDEETAQQVLAQLNAGADFAALAQQYSTDTGSASAGGDVGWDKLNSFVSSYTDALDGLSLGQTSGLVTSEYGIHIIRCTDVWNAPEEINSIDQVPAELVEIIRTQMADPAAKQSAYSNYIQGQRDSADVQINDMPENVPYNVNMDDYVSSSSSDSGVQIATDDTGVQVLTDEDLEGAEGEAQPTEDGASDEGSDGADTTADSASGETGAAALADAVNAAAE